ncbi:MAG: hypothetical protein KatS3mg111_0626 [Pirellulaceae bacterium]|nr:MAG: hypothetical protein KatS3mg111_0626 [Pirellulaceae bacterium]
MSNATVPEVAGQGLTSCGLLLDALDVLMFRHARPFGQAASAESHTAPFPQTVFGAVTTALLQALGCPWERFVEALRQEGTGFADALVQVGLPAELAGVRTRGPWLVRSDPDSDAAEDLEMLFPPPADLRRSKDDPAQIVALSPVDPPEIPGWESTRAAASGLAPLWHTSRQRLTALDNWLTHRGIAAYLAGQIPQPEDLVDPRQLWAIDRRTGIGVQSDRGTANEGLIYSASFLTLNQDRSGRRSTRFYIEVDLPQELQPGGWPAQVPALPLGGEGRYVAITPLASAWDWSALEPKQRERSRLLLTTPVLLEQPPIPKALSGSVQAVAMQSSRPVSGWDLARGGPKPSRQAIMPGTVWYLNRFPVRLPDLLADDAWHCQQGWGGYLRGVW